MFRDLNKRYVMTMGITISFILGAIYISVTNGTFDISIIDVFRTIFRINPVPEHDLVIFDFRLPRIIIAAFVGLGLGIAGAVVQGITRNGLADPGILGVNAGAGTAIVIFMFFFQGQMKSTDWVSIMMMPLFGLVGGLGAAILIYMFSWRNGRLDSQRLLLTGIAIGSGFGAFSMYISLKMKATDFEMAAVWVSGSIYNSNWQYIVAMLPWLIILIPIVKRKAYLLDLFQLEETSITSLGVSVEREKSILLLSSIGLVSACVSVAGSIGFVGLMAPHIAKRLVGIQHKYVIPTCGVIGMLLVIVSDFIAKTIFTPVELPVGIVISIIGVPYFLYLLYKAKA
ncbi:iron ABC transporter permease [Bacillus cytotoxicus]|uniref:Transport system permease protein n=2 Tax=Bacillus TaxID=1386 RepID=A0AAX2CIL9_9BACI|nr:MULTISPECIES: iron ABC transporter permease [Bacillus cereus group]QTR69765.1 iron ABC transporter permease [Bacillus cytotoxicus]QTR81633.1 iron ABC transporter permease [Bacillus cytotoxicus]QTR85370.1 iron ABC transporter permease [Bacillus cytotoxicus]SCL96292.1 Transport system permease protein [Bacillus cytotoxicus]HDR4571994.1 iron ABC transporter permease [Bacillus cytotoxicus]